MNCSGDYHNEIDPYAAQWIRNLMKAGLIPEGEVDERSITDVPVSDLHGFKRWHFFSGVGGWSLALRLAGWPDDREICTGSAPCQPFSVAGKGKGTDDHRHLWPDFFRIIRAIRPAVCMGEQVHAAARQEWLDGVLSDLESIGYAGDALSVPACAVNAPHRRDRLWWCAEDRSIVLGHGHGHGHGQGLAQRAMQPGVRSAAPGASEGQDAGDADDAVGVGRYSQLGNASSSAGGRDSGSVSATEGRFSGARPFDGNQSDGLESSGGGDYPDCNDAHAHAHVSGSSEGRQQRGREFGGSGGAQGNCDGDGSNASGKGSPERDAGEVSRIAIPEREAIELERLRGSDSSWPAPDTECSGSLPSAHAGVHSGEESSGSRHVESIRHRGAWDDAAWIICHAGKARRVGLSQSGIRSLVDDGRSGFGGPRLRTGTDAEITPLLAQGVKARVGKLRAFGNMIVPQVAAEMLKAYMSCRP